MQRCPPLAIIVRPHTGTHNHHTKDRMRVCAKPENGGALRRSMTTATGAGSPVSTTHAKIHLTKAKSQKNEDITTPKKPPAGRPAWILGLLGLPFTLWLTNWRLLSPHEQFNVNRSRTRMTQVEKEYNRSKKKNCGHTSDIAVPNYTANHTPTAGKRKNHAGKLAIWET